ncbi:hypothetical protein [Erythrobacter rubeus]|uniref:Cbb3-type cytochrome oxidase assembly protein CcoS n=1 Tax=Erythrobacter rubeus TaxID=2760803 RepID=A0ABR8KTN4_9SPHN|nr:hypothetical protein [Erythrobacter rubeus]MBD2842578.1 hypothetical protein [Erythrobacter rubeus]
MTFTVVFATIFLVAFVIIGGVVMYLSKTIDHGEARFDSSGQEIKDEPERDRPVRPARRLGDEDERQ